MEHISTREAAAKWGVTLRYVQRLLHENRIPGVKKYSGAWLIPEGAEKPAGARRERGNKPERPFFTLPRKCPLLTMTPLYGRPGSADAVADALSYDREAQTLFRAGMAYLRGNIDGAAELASELAFDGERPDLLIAVATLRCVLTLYRGDTAALLAAKERLEKMTCLTESERTQRDFALGYIMLSLYDISGFPDCPYGIITTKGKTRIESGFSGTQVCFSLFSQRNSPENSALWKERCSIYDKSVAMR